MALLDVVLGYDCNLACDYCTITPEMRRRALPIARVAAEIERAAARGFRDVAFTGGEPEGAVQAARPSSLDELFAL